MTSRSADRTSDRNRHGNTLNHTNIRLLVRLQVGTTETTGVPGMTLRSIAADSAGWSFKNDSLHLPSSNNGDLTHDLSEIHSDAHVANEF